MKLYITLALFALLFASSASHTRGGKPAHTMDDFRSEMEAYLRFVAKPYSGRRLVDMMSQQCMAESADLHENSNALQEAVNALNEASSFSCGPSSDLSSTECFASLPGYAIDDFTEVCDAEGGQPLMFDTFIVFCEGKSQSGQQAKVTIQYDNLVNCVAAESCNMTNLEDFQDDARESMIDDMENEIEGLSDAYCWADGDGLSGGAIADGKDGLSGGEIAGIVIGLMIGAALLLALGYFIYRKSRTTPTDTPDADETKVKGPEIAVDNGNE
mmetsp:Transcript_3023/g.4932  ORF Transcript_3023/g.4932 Transcript_3023/m.4932 type:complete len:271 (+) Transcript_3023:211-1023(+)